MDLSKLKDYKNEKKNIEITKFAKKNLKSEDYKIVFNTADLLFEYLNQDEIYEKIKKANVERAHSDEIKNIFLEQAKETLGFHSEKEGLFKNYNSSMRPDYFKPLESGGIILEVERARTITNNNDLLDFWKCHICKEARHLILVVPKDVSHTSNIYKTVCRRIALFFEEPNYTNVDTAIIIGY